MTDSLRRLSWAATFVATLTSPLVVAWVHNHGHSLTFSIVLGFFSIGAFRGAVDLALRNLDLVGAPLTLDADDYDMAQDALMRRRLFFWKGKFKLFTWFALTTTIAYLMRGGSWGSNATWLIAIVPHALKSYGPMAIILPFYFIFNFLILMGPMAFNGIRQMIHLEPGDADFGVRIGDVRGQTEAKEEIRKVVTLWQAGEAFVKSGGKRERGILFLGAPGTGKTMLAKAIATSFNSPISIMPGSAFAQTFIGMDVMIVGFMMWKAKKLAKKWGGQAIIFIDEIDAVGMRRQALAGGGSLQPQMPGGMMGGMGGGQQGLQSILVAMDGIDKPPFLRKLLTNKVNLWLDASFIVPQKIGRMPLRVARAKPDGTQVFFIGATNVALTALDPALVRAGRLGRHIHFRTPTKRDRLDIFDLYLGRVSHDPVLDTTEARDEIARVTDGYSPADIEQVCSIALTYAHHSGREGFSRADLLEAMVTVEAGTALGWGYESEEEERSTAIHEAGHAVCSYIYEKGTEAVRLSIKKRGSTGGHHMAVETIERFAKQRDELMDRLVTLLGAYAAELEFYGTNTQGVGGDLQMASHLAGTMVGRWGMPAPQLPEGANRKDIEKIGATLVAVAGPMDVKLPQHKTKAEHLILGYAFITARAAIQANRFGVEKITERLLREKEVYGDDLGKLLVSAGLIAPVIDWADLPDYLR